MQAHRTIPHSLSSLSCSQAVWITNTFSEILLLSGKSAQEALAPCKPRGNSGCCSGGQLAALPPGGRNHSSKKTQNPPNRFHEKSRGVGGNVLVNFVWLFEPLPDTRASHLNLTHFSFAFCSSPLGEHKAEEVGIYGLQPFPSASPCYFQRFSI